MAPELLVVSGVRKEIKRQTILEDIHFTVPRGRVVALCGGNGAGKSTLLRMIVGILQPTRGTIFLMGQERQHDRLQYAAQLGYMPDDYLFGQGLSALETLQFWASLREVPKERVMELIATVGLQEVQRRKVSTFSKGMRQRLLFAQALLAKPPLLVMDEPTNGLDPYWMESFTQQVLEAKQQGHGIIFSTHQLDIAEAVADDIYFLKQGVVVRHDPQGALREQYGQG